MRHPSKPDAPVAITDCVGLSKLFSQARELETLDRRLREPLPRQLSEQVRLASIHGPRMVFVASTSAWASRLRLQQRRILETAHILGITTRSLLVKVAPLPVPAPAPALRKPLSATAASYLREAAAISSDPDMRSQLLALAALANTEDETED